MHAYVRWGRGCCVETCERRDRLIYHQLCSHEPYANGNPGWYTVKQGTEKLPLTPHCSGLLVGQSSSGSALHHNNPRTTALPNTSMHLAHYTQFADVFKRIARGTRSEMLRNMEMRRKASTCCCSVTPLDHLGKPATPDYNLQCEIKFPI